ncbi:Wzz/FepE/Etk N-terminal domain-containing protein [Flavobacteriales bacterium]|nr:Wzz/FepE/Etk N-terminal domain-containing protein [Flavobacteriales bacterium]
MTEYKNNSELLGLLLRWWKHLMAVAVIALILSAVFSSSFIITPKYKSFAVLYPANIIPMGTETPTEQMLQVLESDQIRDSVVEMYNLFETYGIDPEAQSAKAALIREYQAHVTFRRTEYQSVVIEVLDTDPEQARDMVDAVIFYFNRKERFLQKEKAMELVKILQEQVDRKKHEMDSMETVLAGIRTNYGILDYGLQTEYATERYLEVISTPSLKANSKEIEPLLNALKEKGGEFLSLSEHLWRVRGGYNNLKEQLEAAVRDVEKNLTYCSIISNPVIADKKAYPIRWLIVLVSVLATLLLSILFLGVVENLRSPNEA